MSEPSLDEIGTSLQELEKLLADLRDRYEQVKVDEPLRSQLQQEIQDQKQRLTSTPKANLETSVKAEIAELSEQLDEVEMRLESRLVSWLGLREYFWQIARFGGMGVVLGWGLATWMMNDRMLQHTTTPASVEQVK